MKYSLFDPANIEDPYPAYARLREEDPFHRLEDIGYWMLSRYDDVQKAIIDYKTYSSEGGMEKQMGEFQVVPEAPFFLSLDPPTHSHYKKVVNKCWNMQTHRAYQPNMRGIVGLLLDNLSDEDEFDIVDRFAVPLPILVIADILGISRDMQGTFRNWTNVLIGIQNFVFSGATPPDEMANEARQAIRDLREFSFHEINSVRSCPRDDFISRLVAAADEDNALNDMEILSIITTFLFGGAETTYKFIGTLMHTLMQNPKALESLREDPSLVDAAIEECLRYAGPAQLVQRQTKTEISFYGKTVPANTPILLNIAAANRDPRRWGATSDSFDINRDATGHLAFGAGLHFCIGAPLTRMEARMAVDELLRRFKSFELCDGGAVRDTSYYLRGLKSMRVRVERA